MAYYAITYVYAAPEEQAKYRPAHREYLGSQIEAGNLIVSVPCWMARPPLALC